MFCLFALRACAAFAGPASPSAVACCLPTGWWGCVWGRRAAARGAVRGGAEPVRVLHRGPGGGGRAGGDRRGGARLDGGGRCGGLPAPGGARARARALRCFPTARSRAQVLRVAPVARCTDTLAGARVRVRAPGAGGDDERARRAHGGRTHGCVLTQRQADGQVPACPSPSPSRHSPSPRPRPWPRSGSGDTTVRLWDALTATPTHVCKGHRHHVLVVAWAPDGRRLASGDMKGVVRCVRALARWAPMCARSCPWRVSARRQAALLKLVPRPPPPPSAPRRLWDTRTARELAVLKGHTTHVTSIAWEPHHS